MPHAACIIGERRNRALRSFKKPSQFLHESHVAASEITDGFTSQLPTVTQVVRPTLMRQEVGDQIMANEHYQRAAPSEQVRDASTPPAADDGAVSQSNQFRKKPRSMLLRSQRQRGTVR